MFLTRLRYIIGVIHMALTDDITAFASLVDSKLATAAQELAAAKGAQAQAEADKQAMQSQLDAANANAQALQAQIDRATAALAAETAKLNG